MEINVVNSLIEAINDLNLEEPVEKDKNIVKLSQNFINDNNSREDSQNICEDNEDSIDEKGKENDEEELNKELVSSEEIKNEYGASGLFERLL